LNNHPGDHLGPCGANITCSGSKPVTDYPGAPDDGNIQLDVFPNPFSHGSTVTFSFPVEGTATLNLIDRIGNEVALLFANKVEQGVRYAVDLDGSKLSQGFYICILRHADGSVKTKKIVCTK
jgi:hypothetical protein